MDAPSREPLRLMTDATLGAFNRPLRDLLTPLLLYKSVFLGGWFEALVRNEPDPAVRDGLVRIARDNVAETVSTLNAIRRWGETPHDPEVVEQAAGVVRRRAIQDLLALKEGNNETGLYVAMRAPTPELRQVLVRLADQDRRQADQLRALLGRARVADARVPAAAEPALGAHAGRGDAQTLSRAIRSRLEAARALGEVVVRVVVSGESLRHLRDEGAVDPDGTMFGLPVDVEFGWRGECWSFVTDERVRLAELLSREGTR